MASKVGLGLRSVLLRVRALGSWLGSGFVVCLPER